MNKVFFVFPLIVFSLITAILGGWLRIGWDLPLSAAAAHHGALMTGSFLGTLIFLERAVTFRSRWVLLLPLINGLSIIFFIINKPSWAIISLIIGSGGFFIMCCYFVYAYKELYYYVFLAGAASLLAGFIVLYNLALYAAAVHWWMLFLLFTIVAERLELTRFLPLGKIKKGWLLVSLGAAQLAVFLPFHGVWSVTLAISFLSIAAWLLLNDMARRSVSLQGQHRYSALLLLTGYVWLLITGLFFLLPTFPFWYDAVLHSFFIGFVFSMIFSHAPIILPAAIKKPYKVYRPTLYVWFVVLQASLLLRIVGDVGGATALRRWGGMINGVVLILFFITIIVIVLQENKRLQQRLSKA